MFNTRIQTSLIQVYSPGVCICTHVYVRGIKTSLNPNVVKGAGAGAGIGESGSNSLIKRSRGIGYTVDWRWRTANTANNLRASSSSSSVGVGSVVGEGLSLKRKGKPIVRRSAHILLRRVGSEVLVHTGRSTVPLKITFERVGHRFGEFASTTAWVSVSKDSSSSSSTSIAKPKTKQKTRSSPSVAGGGKKPKK